MHIANGIIQYSKEGIVDVSLDNGLQVELKDVIYWPGAPLLLSVPKLVDKGVKVDFGSNKAVLSRNDQVLYEAVRYDNMFVVNLKTIPKAKCLISVAVWHNRLNHCGKKRLMSTLGDKVKRQDVDTFFENLCEGCVKGKVHREPVLTGKIPVNEKRQPLELLVADTVGPYPLSIDKKRGALIVSDAASQYRWFMPFYRKSEVPKLFSGLVLRLEAQFPNQLRSLRTDNGTEFCNARFDAFCRRKGLEHEKSLPFIHEMNGRAENVNRLTLEALRAALYGANLTTGYWSFAGDCVTTTANLISKTTDKRSPWEYLYQKSVPIEKLRVFGTEGYAHISREIRKKLDPVTCAVRFLGYSSNFLSYRVQNLDTGRIFLTSSFYCNEESQLKPSTLPRLLGATGEYTNAGEIISGLNIESEEILPDEVDEDIIEDYNDVSAEEIEHLETLPIVNSTDNQEITQNINEPIMPTRLEVEQEEENVSSIDVFPENTTEQAEDSDESEKEQEESTNFCDINTSNIIPDSRTRSGYTYNLQKLHRAVLKYKLASKFVESRRYSMKGYRNYKQAVQSNPEWEHAYRKEIEKLEVQGELTVVQRKKDMQLLPFIEVLTEKPDNVTGGVKLKVRLAVRGDLEQEKPKNSYSPASGSPEIRLMLAALKGLKCFVAQGDCPSAYLNGRLPKDIFLYLPEGHPDKDTENSKVYRCPASIYGLAIAGRIWYFRFCEEVAKFGLKPMQRTPTIFKLKEGNEVLFLILYVDDFLIGSQSAKLLEKVKKNLFEAFKVKCTEEINKFIGMQVENEGNNLFIHQKEMIEQLGIKYRIEKIYSTPMSCNLKWSKDSAKLEDVKKLQQLFGELNYVAGSTRPDIAYSTNRIARKLQNPTKEVYRCAKKILAYLVGTSEYCLKYSNNTVKETWSLEVFSDSSFADILEEKFKSTGGYVVYLNGNVITWKTKKLKYVCSSSGEAEYLGLFEAVKEGLYLGYLIQETFEKNVFPVKFYCDNKAVLDVIHKTGATELNKFMSTKYFKLQEWIEQELIVVEKVRSENNVADGFTKSCKRFNEFRSRVLHPRGSVLHISKYEEKRRSDITCKSMNAIRRYNEEKLWEKLDDNWGDRLYLVE